jgi:hypothetical protein
MTTMLNDDLLWFELVMEKAEFFLSRTAFQRQGLKKGDELFNQIRRRNNAY